MPLNRGIHYSLKRKTQEYLNYFSQKTDFSPGPAREVNRHLQWDQECVELLIWTDFIVKTVRETKIATSYEETIFNI